MTYSFNAIEGRFDLVENNHSNLINLTVDTHTQYALLAGRSGGQILNLGISSGDGGEIHSTAHATKGTINIGNQWYLNEATGRLSLGTNSPYKTAKMFVQYDYTGTSDAYGTFLGLTWTASANNSAFVGGFGFVVETEGNKSYNAQVKGFDGQVIHNGSGTLNQGLGGNFITQISAAGGDVSAAYGVNTSIQNNNAASTLSLGVNYQAGPPVATGAISAQVGMWIYNQGATNIGTAAAMYIEATTGATTNYGILALGGNHVFNAANTSQDFTVMGATDNNLLFIDTSANKIGIGTGTPANKLDIEGALTVGASYSGTNTAPTNGILSQGTVAVATTSYTTPGATSTTWGFITKADGATGGLYYRAVQTADGQLTMGNYNLLSGRSNGTVATTGTQIIGTQNECYPATAGGSITHNVQAYGTYNFVQAVSQATYAQVYGTNTIVLSDADSGQTFGEVVIMQVSGTGTTDSAYFAQITNSGSTSTRTTGAFGAIVNISSINETTSGLNLDTTGQGTINDPTVIQAGIYVNWNIPGTDANNKKYALYIAGNSSRSAKSYFGDYVGIGQTVPATALNLAETKTLTSSPTDDYASALTLDPGYTGAFTVTRHNYIDAQNVSTAASAVVTDAALVRFDAAAGTHKAVDSGTTKTTPGGVDAWIKYNINGTIYYVPAYTSKTA